MKKYAVAIAGLGTRGKIHTRGILDNNDSFEVTGICDPNQKALAKTAKMFNLDCVYPDAETMLKETKPDVFCFITHPNLRLPMIKLGIKYGVKAISFEKPMATSLKEATLITELCRNNNIKAVVSHQQKYLSSMQKLKSIVESGAIGKVQTMHAATQAWMSQLGTHFMDYAIWINHGLKVKWVVGHAHGKKLLTDIHPSPDYIMGQAMMENGVRLFIECGYLSPSSLTKECFWVDNRLTVYGSHGYAWAETDGAWGVFSSTTGGNFENGTSDVWSLQQEYIQKPYYNDLAAWLNDSAKLHPCNIDISYHGYEVLEGLCLSALNNTRVDLPILDMNFEDIIERMKRELPDVLPIDQHLIQQDINKKG